MHIEFVEIQNFRKLKSCRVDFTDKVTVFIGANNSGKTSAMDAIIYFLGNKKGNEKKISTTDFTLSNWIDLDKIGEKWVSNDESSEKILWSEWSSYLPSLDVWIKANESEVHYVSHLIPTLDWKAGLLGVRFRLEPIKIEELYKEYREAYKRAEEISKKASGELKLWPQSLRGFLNKKLSRYFKIQTYLLDPKLYSLPKNCTPSPQIIEEGTFPLEGDPFSGLVKIDIIRAQRGFSDPYTGLSQDEKQESSRVRGTLSSQLKEYYSNHLNPLELPDENDVGVLDAIKQAQDVFDKKMQEGFTSAFQELQSLGYPGFSDPKVSISCKVDPVESINHSSAVQFDVIKDDTGAHASLRLPEKYNGLGYQNLISMVFNLMRFRDEWMQVGKVKKRRASEGKDSPIEPLHLVLVEEPEAHLHAQVQQVFIRKAYDVLRNHNNLKEKNIFTSQLVVSTHSSHIAHEIDFTSLRYFKRKPAINDGEVSCAIVVNLSSTFGSKDDTTQFATRYLKTTHCDIFFADAVIMVEGSAEKILLPHFIKTHLETLNEGYISLLEVGGSHAHRLRDLIEHLGVITLIVSDLDSFDPANNRKSVPPKTGKGYLTRNSTLKKWLPKREAIDTLLDTSSNEKEDERYPVRVAYQIPLEVTFKNSTQKVIPYTFEDALAFENIEFFSTAEGEITGMLGAFVQAISNSENIKKLTEEFYGALNKGKKAAFALDLLFNLDPQRIFLQYDSPFSTILQDMFQ